MQKKHLFPLVHTKTQSFLNGYVESEMVQERMDEYIIPPGLGNKAGILGAIAMASEIA